MLIMWLACVQCCAGALERVCLSFGWRVCSAVRVHLSGCAYHLAGVCAVLCGALERVCLSFGRFCVQGLGFKV